MQGQQRVALLGDHEQAGRFAIQPVDQFQELRLRPGGAQLLDHAERHAAAAVHRHAGGLVDHQHGVILVDHRELGGRHGLGRARIGQPQGRNADDVALGHPVVGLDTALVYPHLAAADRLIDVRLGHAFAQPQQVIVQALAGMFGVDLDHPDGGGLQGRKFLCALRKATYNRDSLKGLN